MTAISGASASASREAANSFPAEIRLPGSDRTFEHRAFLRGLGLRWDPVGHAWHGLLPATTRRDLESRFGLVPRVVRPLESFQEVVLERKEAPTPSLSILSLPIGSRHLPRDSSQTRFESRLAFGAEDVDEVDALIDPAAETRRFSLFETTSGLPDDSRDEDERWEERQLRDLRGRVKAARAAISAAPGAGEVLRQDRVKAAWFYARFGITEVISGMGCLRQVSKAGITSSRGRSLFRTRWPGLERDGRRKWGL